MKKIAFIGAGNMGAALIRGIVTDGLYPPSVIMAADPDKNRREKLELELGISSTGDNSAAVSGADIICLAIKPQIFAKVLNALTNDITENHLLISIMAGISTRKIEDILGKKVRVVRVMPNTPALVNAGMAGVSSGRYAGLNDLKDTVKIMSVVGEVLEVEESLIDAITAISGSGPAYLFYFVEALTRAGEKLGLSSEQAELLARKTMIGSARLLKESGLSPMELRKMVTSPGGTTEAALKTFHRLDFENIVKKAARAARDRAKELGD